jgi:uncharacterized protein (TIGR03437 family)
MHRKQMKYLVLAAMFAPLWAVAADKDPGQTHRLDLLERAKPYLEAAQAAGNAFVNVSSASGLPNIAADSLATVFGSSLAQTTETGAAPYPTSLGGISLQVVDKNGVLRLAQLLYVSPSQINYLIPAGTSPGLTTTNIVEAAGNILTSTAQIQSVAPGLFTANGNGQGVVSVTAYRLVDLVISAPVIVYQCLDVPGTCQSVPINLGVDSPVFVTFYTTGLRGRSSDAAVSVSIGSQSVAVRSITSGDDSSVAAGLDAILVGLPLSLRGSGEVDVVILVDGMSSNHGTINIQ